MKENKEISSFRILVDHAFLAGLEISYCQRACQMSQVRF